MLLYSTVIACADPESLARGGATMTMNVFFFNEEKENPNSTKSGPSSTRQGNAI